MIKSYITLALRYFLRKKAYTLINLSSLLLGVSSACLVLLYLVSEYTYDAHFPGSERVYRLNYQYRDQTFALSGFVNWWDATEEEQLIKINNLRAISGIEEVAQFNSTQSPTHVFHHVFVETGKTQENRKRFAEKRILFTNTGTALWNIFKWEMLYGEPSLAFEGHRKAILTRESAIRYFGDNWYDRIGDEALYLNGESYEISGVIHHEQSASHFEFDLILLQESIPSWGAFVYCKLAPQIQPEDVNPQIQQALINAEPYISEDPDEKGSYLQPIEDIHFSEGIELQLKKPGNRQYLFIFGLIGLIIVVITATNYINLTTALYTRRRKETGMRKVMGAARSGVQLQLLGEAVLLSLLSLLPSLLLIELILPGFNQLMNTSLVNLYLRSWLWFGISMGATLLLGLLSGLYPSLLLSGKDVLSLLHKKNADFNGFSLQRALFLLQFSLLIVLGTTTIFINQQLDFINKVSLGFEKEGVLTFNFESKQDYEKLRDRLSAFDEISVVGSGMVPGQETGGFISYKFSDQEEVFKDATFWEMDWEALEALKIDIQGISKENAPAEILIINQVAAEKLKNQALLDSKEKLIGKELLTHTEYQNEDLTYGEKHTIGGMVDNIHLFSLKEKISPLLIRVVKEPLVGHQMIIKLNTGKLSNTISKIRDAYAEVVSDIPLEIEFLDEEISLLYDQEQRIGRLSFYLSMMALVIALLGLVGITAYLVSLRTKEIGIRKTLGASVTEILLMLSKEYIVLVGIATLIASPFAYVLVDSWLTDFAYHIDINPLVFFLVGLLALLITVAVVVLQSVKTASAQPAATIRDLR
ncbi:MAG: ABC transporter permease [Cyclobacteriaceae bacterium]